jgi:hypothetical protein
VPPPLTHELQEASVTTQDETATQTALDALRAHLATPTEPKVHHAGAVAPRGSDDRGLLVRWIDVKRWPTKTDAVKAARAIGWKPDQARRAHSHLTWGWVLVDDLGLVLTEHGYAAQQRRYAAEHHTRTYERHHGLQPYNVNSRGMTGYRPEFSTFWVCSCGNGGFGENRDRASARQRAKLHREDPAGYPGQPWQRATVTRIVLGS